MNRLGDRFQAHIALFRHNFVATIWGQLFVTFSLMTTGAFSQNVSKSFSELKLVTDNLLFMLEEPTEKPLKASILSRVILLQVHRYHSVLALHPLPAVGASLTLCYQLYGYNQRAVSNPFKSMQMLEQDSCLHRVLASLTTVQEWCLFCSAIPIVQLLLETADYQWQGWRKNDILSGSCDVDFV